MTPPVTAAGPGDPDEPRPRVALHAGQVFLPAPGGIGRYVAALVEHLPAAGVSVTPFAARPARRPWPRAWTGALDLGRPRGRGRSWAWQVARRPRVHLDADVVHAPSLAVPSTDRPLVVTVNDVAFLHRPEAYTAAGRVFHRRGLAVTRREAALVIVPSRHSRAEAVAAGIDPARVRLVPHGVAVPAAPEPGLVDRRLARLGVAAPYVLVVGTVEPRKGHATITAALRRLRTRHPDVRLVVAGPRGWGTVPDLDDAALLGRVDDRDLDALYRGAVSCAVPSVHEGFGLPVLEAMARDCPVVASDATSLPEVVGDAGVLVDPADVEGWADALAALLEDPDLRRDLVGRGRDRADAHSWAASAAGHARVYAEAAGRRTATDPVPVAG